MATLGAAFRETDEGLRIRLRVQPGASRNAIEGLAKLDDGRTVLRLRVSAPPEDGKANAAVIRMLARAWKLPKSSLRIVSGQTSRQKELLIEGEATRLRQRLNELLVRP